MGACERTVSGVNTLRTRDLGTILSIWAHPDDETYLAGGLMAAAAGNGQRVVCVSASAGEQGTSDPDRWPPARLGPVRRLEGAAAMAALGVKEHRVLGLPDGELARYDAAGAMLVGKLLDHVQPDTILTFGADGMTFHPDHLAVHRWVVEAWERRGRPARLLQAVWTREQLARFGGMNEEHGVYMTDARPVGVPADQLAVHLRLDGRLLDRKLVALRAMATQTASLVEAVGPEAFAAQAAEECFVDAAEVLARPTAPVAAVPAAAVPRSVSPLRVPVLAPDLGPDERRIDALSTLEA
jgi:LmbE family N-acetylglucosaminyl deacetylase